MFASFLITFRETLEAALVVGIILAYLTRTGRAKHNNVVYTGIGAALMVSLLCALLFQRFAGGFEGIGEQLFEGITMLLAAVLLTSMIFWMLKQRKVAEGIHARVDAHMERYHTAGLFGVTFLSVLREGVETVIFLGAAQFAQDSALLIGALLGVAVAISVGYLMFVEAKRLPLKRFFQVTSILLVLFAAGLVAHSAHEFAEAGVLPELIEHVWDLNPAPHADGGHPLFHEKGYIGSMLVALFGYNGDPALIEVLAYVLYLALITVMWQYTKKEKAVR